MSEDSPTEAFGPYLVYEKLGVGGMAQVHRAIAAHAQFQRPVALKRMLSHIADNEEMVKSFVREARLASYLRHENVAETYDLGKVGDIYFIVMELITGRTLRDVLRHCGSTTGPMPVPIALNILNQICDALDYAHNLCDETGEPLGIIHRDVSPSNIIVSDRGIVKLIDFGIAKASRAGMQTLGGTLKGKFAYMAPEYIAGRIDARADLFAVGVIAHELLTNRSLFSGRDDVDTLTRVRDMHIDPPSKKNPLVPPEIDDIVMTALARDPDRRWQHATALRTALTTLTRRLDLVASNAQVVHWLDGAFPHQATPHARAETDTEPDGEPISPISPISPIFDDDDLDSSGEQRTVHLSPKTPPITLVLGDGMPRPPIKTPLGTPAYIPAQRASIAMRNAGDAAVVDRSNRHAALASHGTTSAAVPPMARPSASLPVRARSSSGLQPPLHRVGQSFQAVGSPMLPTFPAAPLATPRPSAQPSVTQKPYDPVRSAMVQHDLAQRVSARSVEAAVPARRSHVLAVVLLVLAAAIAAITVSFLLPLLT